MWVSFLYSVHTTFSLCCRYSWNTDKNTRTLIWGLLQLSITLQSKRNICVRLKVNTETHSYTWAAEQNHLLSRGWPFSANGCTAPVADCSSKERSRKRNSNDSKIVVEEVAAASSVAWGNQQMWVLTADSLEGIWLDATSQLVAKQKMHDGLQEPTQVSFCRATGQLTFLLHSREHGGLFTWVWGCVCAC